MKAYVKDWFVKKNFNYEEAQVVNCGEYEVLKETEKALQLKAESDGETVVFWCPKSCIEIGTQKFMSKEELEELKKTAEVVVANDGRRFLIKK